MSEDKAIARASARELLQQLVAGLGQPPLHYRYRTAILAVLDALGELDLQRRFEVREALAELLHEGERS